MLTAGRAKFDKHRRGVNVSGRHDFRERERTFWERLPVWGGVCEKVGVCGAKVWAGMILVGERRM